jgi:3-oxoacyl-[acyl-carrier protein] reductase
MGKTAVVTGGGTGIGKAIAARLAREGAHVVITGRRGHILDKAVAEIGCDVVGYSFDASCAADVERFARDLGELDVLVNNAGGNTDFDRAAPAHLEDVGAAWRSNFESNVMSAVFMTTALLPSIRESGAIITIGSIAADKGAGSYGAAKAAIASWNVDLARTAGPRHVTANIVSPGYVADTEFFRDILDEDRRSALVAASMTGRAGVPDDIANMVAFLASPEARQITGQVLAVNGGEWTSR